MRISAVSRRRWKLQVCSSPPASLPPRKESCTGGSGDGEDVTQKKKTLAPARIKRRILGFAPFAIRKIIISVGQATLRKI
jgi:hypothetical protein